MKTKLSLRTALARARWVLLLGLWPSLAPAVSSVPVAPAKTHTLFMGADLSIEHQHQLCHVDDVQGNFFIIHVDGKEVKIPAKWDRVALKMAPALKIAAGEVAVEKLKVERAYTDANDPVKIFMREQGVAIARMDEIATLERQYDVARSKLQGPGFNPAAGSLRSTLAAGDLAGLYDAAAMTDPTILERVINLKRGEALADSGNYFGLVGHMQDELARELYDAINVEFNLSSPSPLRRPYVVVMVEFHARDARPNARQHWLYAAELDNPHLHPGMVRVKVGGFPAGYVIDQYQIHVYDGPRELASNVAGDRVALSRDEAFAYLKLDYLQARRGATAPAAPAIGRPDLEVQRSLGLARLGQTYFVKVTKDGLPLAAFTDPELTRPVDPELAAVIAAVRFFPALEDGKSVDGVAQLRFSHLGL